MISSLLVKLYSGRSLTVIGDSFLSLEMSVTVCSLFSYKTFAAVTCNDRFSLPLWVLNSNSTTWVGVRGGWRISQFWWSGVPGVRSGWDGAHCPPRPVLAGGADGPGGVGWEVGDRDCLDPASQRISKEGELDQSRDRRETWGQDWWRLQQRLEVRKGRGTWA